MIHVAKASDFRLTYPSLGMRPLSHRNVATEMWLLMLGDELLLCGCRVTGSQVYVITKQGGQLLVLRNLTINAFEPLVT